MIATVYAHNITLMLIHNITLTLLLLAIRKQVITALLYHVLSIMDNYTP